MLETITENLDLNLYLPIHGSELGNKMRFETSTTDDEFVGKDIPW